MAGMIALNNKDMLGPTVPWVNPNKVRNGCCSKRLLFETVAVRNGCCSKRLLSGGFEGFLGEAQALFLLPVIVR